MATKKILSSLYFFIPATALILIVTEIFATNELVSEGRKIHDVDLKIETVSNENDLLASQIASASALATIQQKAKDNGFIKPANYLTIGPETVAFHLPQ